MNIHANQNGGFRVLEDFVCHAIPDPSVVAPTSLKAEIAWLGDNPQDLVEELGLALPEEHRDLVSLAVEPAGRKPGVLALDAGIVVATIQGGDRVLAAFITALLSRALLSQPAKSNGVSVIISVPGDVTHELSVDASPDQIKQVVCAFANAQGLRVEMTIRK